MQALKFFTKSARLNNTEKAFTYMNKCTEKLSDPNHHKHNEKAKETFQTQHEEKPKEKNYTPAQVFFFFKYDFLFYINDFIDLFSFCYLSHFFLL